jgi:D-sedoheptulose 7-phosphate isomerase
VLPPIFIELPLARQDKTLRCVLSRAVKPDARFRESGERTLAALVEAVSIRHRISSNRQLGQVREGRMLHQHAQCARCPNPDTRLSYRPASFILLQPSKSCINTNRFPTKHPAMSNLPQFRDAVAAATETLRALSTLEPQMAQATDLIDQCLRAGNKLLVCGNGGSAADASHFATELVVRFARNRPALPAICLASDGGIVTAAANDYGFDEIFARQVMAFGRPGDVLIALTTSGNSQNVKRALQQAKARKLKTIALLGRDGASTIGIADVEFLVKGDSTARIQEAHQLLLHVLCEIIESRLDNP